MKNTAKEANVVPVFYYLIQGQMDALREELQFQPACWHEVLCVSEVTVSQVRFWSKEKQKGFIFIGTTSSFVTMM